jgi:uncharacterized membrane protein YbhN (UPF0104 family)
MTRLRSLYTRAWFRYALTAGLLLLVALKVQPQHLLRAAGSARAEDVIAALALTIPFLLLKALRWHLMLRAAAVEATFGEELLSLVGGMGLALVTPARLGELARVAYLRDPQKLKIGGLVMIDKAFDVLVLCGLSVAGAWALLGPPAGVAFFLAAAAGLLVIFHPVHLARFLRAAFERLPLGRKLGQVWESLDCLSLPSTLTFLALTVLSFAVVLLQFGIILLSWHASSPNIVFLTFPLVVLTNVLPITVGGLGVREGAAAALMAHYGVPAADAALAAFLMFALNTALPGLVGAVLLPVARPGAARQAQTLEQI